MRIYIDEAGPFVPPKPPRSLFSLVLALIIPTAIEKDLFYEFLRLRDTWPNQDVEIKGSSLDESQAAQVIDLVLSYDTLAESALLAGLPQAPSDYNPFLNPQAARARRNEVLAKMADQHYITQASAAAAERAPLGLHPNRYYSNFHDNYFLDFVRQELINHYGAARIAAGRRHPSDAGDRRQL